MKLNYTGSENSYINMIKSINVIKSLLIIRVALKVVVFLLIGSVLVKSWDLYTDYEVKKFIKDPVIKSDTYLNGSTHHYSLINGNYRILCLIAFEEPYKQEVDTTFYVYDKKGKFKTMWNKRSPVLKQYFREYYKW